MVVAKRDRPSGFSPGAGLRESRCLGLYLSVAAPAESGLQGPELSARPGVETRSGEGPCELNAGSIIDLGVGLWWWSGSAAPAAS